MPAAHTLPAGDSSLPVHPDRSHPFLEAVLSLPGRIVVSWALAGGLVAGGFLVAASTLSAQTSSSSVPQITTLLFLLGAGAGLAHGGLLGYLCHDPKRSRLQVLGTMTRSLVWIVPGLLLSWIAVLWMSLTAAVLNGSSPATFGEFWLVLSWIFGLGVVAWAGVAGFQGALAALRRWPDVRVAAVLMSVVFAILLTWFLSDPPLIWFTQLRVTSGGAVLLAFGASVWIALPVTIGALGLMHRVLGHS